MLHLTKVALGASSLEQLEQRFQHRAGRSGLFISTRNMPKRAEEIAGKGSLYWIVKHQLVARSPITAIDVGDDGRTRFHIGPDLVRVSPRPKRAHQGWRYLEAVDAPPDLGDGDDDGMADLPPEMMSRLAGLGLV